MSVTPNEPNEPGSEAPAQTHIHTAGGIAVTGNVETGGGDFVGRDKNIYIGSVKVPRWLLWILAGAAVVVVAGILVLYRQGRGTQQNTQGSATQIAAVATKVNEPTPTPTATPKPQTMKGRFNIAVAEFGAQGANGVVEQSMDGAKLSTWLAQAMVQALPQSGAIPEFVVWQDEVNRPASNPPIGLRVNQAEARQLLGDDNIGANMVILGQLDQPTAPISLTLDFVYKEPKIDAEPDGDLGRQRIGKAVKLPPVLNEIDETSDPLFMRTQAIIGLSRGLALEFQRDRNNQNASDEKALASYQQLDQQIPLEKWQEGREVLYYFTGRVARRLRRLELAQSMFEKALTLRPDYMSAYLELGNVAYERAQLRLLLEAGVNDEGINQCSSEQQPQSIQQALADKSITPSLPDALADTSSAIGYYEQARQVAPGFDPRAEAIAHYFWANGVRFRGDLHWKLNQLDEAAADLQSAAQALQAGVTALTDNQAYDLVAYSYYGLGLTQRTQAHIARERGETDAALAAFQAATQSFTRCQEFKTQPNANNDTQYQERAACYCAVWQQQVLQEENEIPLDEKGTNG